MNIAHAILLALLIFPTCFFAAPLPGPPEAPLVDFRDTLAQLDDKILSVERKTRSFGTKEKWAAGVVAGLSTVANGGFVISAGLHMADDHRQAAKLRELKQAVARADAAAKARSDRSREGLAKRGEQQVVECAEDALDDGASFKSALSRTPSQRIDDLIHRYTSESRAYDRSWSSHSGDSLDTHDRLTAIESALLRQRQHQHEQLSEHSPFTKTLIGVGVGNAVLGAASAELNVEDTMETERRSKEPEDKLPNVKNLDRETCKRFEGEVEGLDCRKAKGSTQ